MRNCRPRRKRVDRERDDGRREPVIRARPVGDADGEHECRTMQHAGITGRGRRPRRRLAGAPARARRQVDLAPLPDLRPASPSARPASRACSKARTCCAPAQACRALGADDRRATAPGRWRIRGAGIGGARRSRQAPLDFGNAGTGSRLMMGVAGSHPITATFDGDASLRKRPMRRILDPLRRMGVAGASARPRAAAAAHAARAARDRCRSSTATPVASAQIKSAVLLAGLNAPGAPR